MQDWLKLNFEYEITIEKWGIAILNCVLKKDTSEINWTSVFFIDLKGMILSDLYEKKNN